MSSPVTIDIKQEEFEGLLERIKEIVAPEDFKVIQGLISTIIELRVAYHEKTASVTRLLKMIFGPKTEKRKKEKKADGKNSPSKPEEDKDLTGCEDEDMVPSPDSGIVDEPPASQPENKPKGHGRNGASDYPGAERRFFPNEILTPGSPCLLCDGKVYKMKEPGIIIRLFGQPPVKAVINEFEKYRCNLCGFIYYPDSISDIPDERYDETAVSMMALSRYGFGIPSFRLGRLEDCFGIPLPPSTQWDKIESGANKIYPVFNKLEAIAAQGKILHNDDTTMKILELIKENETGDPQRKGMFTSCVMSITDEHRIAIFKTGRKHAGENIGNILEKREPDRAPPIQMTDASSRNWSHDFEVILSNCLTHGRRKFVEIENIFPDQCGPVIDFFAQVYTNDRIVKEEGLTDQERLEYHQEHSGPVMEKFHEWLTDQFEQKLVEPNSSLGKVVSYMLKHWEKLTLFLREPGAPLDNNICEQALKMTIMHRKNSLFYKTQHGANIGDIYMSLIHTCILNGVNPFDYLTELQRHKKQLFKSPENWMPWNYRETMSSMNLFVHSKS